MRDHYPDVYANTVIINAPFIFRALWSMTKGLLDEKRRNAIHIYGSDYY